MPVDPKALNEENEPMRVPAPARRLSPVAIVLLIVVGVGLVAACAVMVIAAGIMVATR